MRRDRSATGGDSAANSSASAGPASRSGLDPGDVSLVTADTELTPIDLGSYSSRVTFMAGNAALEAAQKMRDLLLAAVALRLEVEADDLRVGDHHVYAAADPGRRVAFPEAVALAEAMFGTLTAVGSYRPPKLADPPEKVLAAIEQRRKGGPGRVGPCAVPAFRFRGPIRVEPPPGWDVPWRAEAVLAGGGGG